MTLRERTTQRATGGTWYAFCDWPGCGWDSEGDTRGPIFRASRKHAAETGHIVAVDSHWQWTITRKEESHAEP